ncbi:MAG TPA: ATP-binding protein [Promineifilum sp.]|nr:ATP-binding protein [Promineifilum sp.]
MQLTIGLEAINSYKRLSYSTWHALAEFVDNSTQSYFDNRTILDEAFRKEESKLTVSILYDRDSKTITIKDNSIGMSETDLEEALKIASRPPRSNSRSIYGMGLKTAACWFGDRWTVTTKKLGEPNVISVTVDVPATAAGNGNLTPIRKEADIDQHYTEITISHLHRGINGPAVKIIKEYLCSIYRCDLRENVLELLFQGKPLKWEGFEDRILRDDQGQLYKRDLDFYVLGKRVTGWVAVLESGGRPYGGFSVLQNKRVIKGYPKGWRPRKIFGQEEGSNDLINQRVCGELFLEDFQVSHTKDDIVWESDEEDMIESELFIRSEDYRRVATKQRKGDQRGPSQLALDNAVNQVFKELSSDEMIDVIRLTEIPPESILKQTSQMTIQHAAKGKPRFDVELGDMRVRFFVDSDASPRDTYYALDWKPDGTIEIAINRNHDYMVQLGNDVADFIRQCVYDGISEFKATQKRGRVEPNTIRFIKDNLLRVPYRIHDDTYEGDDDLE